ncbi:AAA family ATPase [Emticicia sp. CRIBPO]|uniref:AAA family ATPase n=1 Tax=Emticicia sp. CRIBPO TaxID=2683258 RepID=UPI001412AE61|nr:AAA family ATPase [Emticicia sp. CRIBPO]NBA87705.1 AAA family ATPase [Emticicia sp. CRIBPO]
MILHLRNDKILKDASDIKISDFTVLTGENGSGKTQLLEFLWNRRSGLLYFDKNGNTVDDEDGSHKIEYFLTDDEKKPLIEITYSSPGLRNTNIEGNEPALIDTIKQQWSELEPNLMSIFLAYNSIGDRSFSNETGELNEVNFRIADIFKGVSTPGSSSTGPSAKVITLNQLQQIKELASNSGKKIENLTFVDYLIFYPIPLDLFSAALDLLFHQFFLKQKYYKQLTDDIIPPWDTFNEILKRADFNYKARYAESLNENYPYPVKLIDKQNNEIYFQGLSSGETTILALIFVLYNSSNKGHFPQVILFDEPDAHLHPSLTQIFLDVVQEVLVKEHNVKVILTTHSPSTVALAPDDSIYCMDRNLGRPVKQNKKAAINALSSGLTSLTIEESSFGISYNIKKANKHILFTEGITDKIILETVWKKLYPEKEMNFYIQDCFSASFLGQLFNSGDQKPDGIFHQFIELKMIALFDFDSAGYGNWNRNKKFPVDIEKDPRKGLTKFNNGNGYMMLLPVPSIDAISKNVIISETETYEEKSSLTIEGLLFDCEGLKDYFKAIPSPGGNVVYEIIAGKKREFSSRISQLDAAAFVHFKALFEKIDILLSKS